MICLRTKSSAELSLFSKLLSISLFCNNFSISWSILSAWLTSSFSGLGFGSKPKSGGISNGFFFSIKNSSLFLFLLPAKPSCTAWQAFNRVNIQTKKKMII